MNPIRLLILRLRAFVWTAFAMSCISLAVLVGLASLILPYAERFRPEIESFLGDRLGRPVTLEEVEARWTASGPQLIVHGLGIGSRDDAGAMLWVDMANVGFDIYGWIRPDSSGVSYFRLISDHLELIRHADGTWSLAGMDAMGSSPAGSGGALEWVLSQGGIDASANEFLLVDEARGSTLRLVHANLSFSNHDDHQHLSATVESPDGEGQITFELESRPGDEGIEVDFYLSSDELDLAGWFGDYPLAGADVLAGHAALELWGQWGAGRALEVVGQVEGESWILAGEDGLEIEELGLVDTRYGLDSVRTSLRVRWASKEDWTVELEEFQLSRDGRTWPETALAVSRRPWEGTTVFDAAGEFVRIQDVANALVVFEVLPVTLRETLFHVAPHGDLDSVAVSDLRTGWPLQAQGGFRVDGLSLSPYRSMPGLANLRGQVRLDGTRGQFEMDAEEAYLSLPGILRWPVLMERGQGLIEWTRLADQWALNIPDFRFSNPGVHAQGRFHMLAGDGTKPVIDLMARVTEGRVEDARRYWPVNRFKPRLVEWLDRALVDGDVLQGSVMLYGDMDDWPFEGNEGRFEARADVENAVLDFHPDWPDLRDIDMELQFNAIGMSGDSSGAAIAGVRVDAIEADLPRFRAPRLELNAEGTSPGNDLLTFLAETPIQDNYGDYLEGLEVEGDGAAWVNLTLPFGTVGGEMEVVGHLWLQNNLVTDHKWNVEFADTSGRVDFTHQGLEAVDVDTLYRGFPATLSMWTGEFVEEPGIVGLGRLVGVAPASAILSDFPVLDPVLKRIEGNSIWEANLRITEQVEGAPPVAPRLYLETQLEGAEVRLPPPLSKPTGESLPLSIAVNLPDLVQDLEISVGELARMKVNQEPVTGRWRGAVHFGPGDLGEGRREGLSFGGRIDQFDLDQWRELALELLDVGMAEEGEQHWVSNLNLELGTVRFAGRDFTNVGITAVRDPEYWNLTLSGDHMDGSLRLPLVLDENRLMLAEFDRLVWEDVDTKMPEAHLHPDRVPPLRFFAKDLTFLNIPVGTVSFESYPTTEGMHIDQLETQSDVLAITANGDWVGFGEDMESRFAATVTGEDFGRLLDAFGFSGMVDGGQSLIKLDASWQGAPSDFEMAALGGDLDISIGRGEIVEVEPGAGRIFGLLSLTQIPRRLRLDFADLFGSGLLFDSIEGNFQLDSGDAYTDNLTIKSPTAELKIRGRTGLAEQDYNQIITVVPKVGETLPLVGALAGGGAGAAALFVVQGLFSNQIERISQYHYSVTGSWEDPNVDLLGANDGQLSMEGSDDRPEG